MTSEVRMNFGQAIRQARLDKGWTLSDVAEHVLGNPDRKSYVSAVIKGRKSLSELTIAKFAQVLDLPDEVVGPMLDEAAEQDAPQTETERDADAISKELEELRQTLKLSEALAVSLAYEFAEGNPTDLTSALNELRRAFEVAAKQPTTGNLDTDVTAVLEEVRQLNADDRMPDAKLALREALDRKKAQQERVEAEVATLIQSGIDQSVLMRDVEEAARLVVEQADAETPDAADQFAALRAAQEEWYTRGRDQGLAFDLEVSIAVAKSCINRARNADERCHALNDLAISLTTVGERESSTDRLEEAVTAFRAALEAYTRDRVPLDWAMTQNNLGAVLRKLGARESGTARLEEAVAAYRAALEEYTRERVPLDWAMTQNNLGVALQTLGERESGTDRLEDAVTAYRAALEEHTRDRVPLDWAMTQSNLGAALQTLGQRESSTDRLEEAVTAFRAALEELTRDRVPLDWATTQNSLGNVLQTLGVRDRGTDRLEEAVSAYRAALEERTRDRVPFDWAQTQHCLCGLEIRFFEKTGRAEHLDRAEQYGEHALEVYREAGADHYVTWIEEQQLASIAECRTSL